MTFPRNATKLDSVGRRVHMNVLADITAARGSAEFTFFVGDDAIAYVTEVCCVVLHGCSEQVNIMLVM